MYISSKEEVDRVASLCIAVSVIIPSISFGGFCFIVILTFYVVGKRFKGLSKASLQYVIAIISQGQEAKNLSKELDAVSTTKVFSGGKLLATTKKASNLERSNEELK